MNVKISTGEVKSAYRGGRIPLQGTLLIPTGDIAFPGRGWGFLPQLGANSTEVTDFS